MNSKLCVSITEGKPIQIIPVMQKYGFVELCLDKLNYSAFELASVIPFADRVIASFSTCKQEDILSYVLCAAKCGANIIDIPIRYLNSLIVNRAKDNMTGFMSQLLFSYHNFGSYDIWKDEIEKTIERMHIFSPDYYKIAVFCQTRAEIDYLFSFYKRFENLREKLILVPMSDKFPQARVEALKLGTQFMYCHIGKPQAPGQMLYEDMQKILLSL